MQSPVESTAILESLPTPSPSSGPLGSSAVLTVNFIENCFIPNHVELKTQAGRTHYHAILKHVLRPETVDRLLLPYKGVSKSKLKSIPEWPYLDETRLCDISPDHARRLTSLAEKHGYSPQTVKHIKNVVSAIISHAKREGILSGDNPMADVHLPPPKRKAFHVSPIEARALFRMMGHPERQIALIALNGNMSVSEVCGLQWNHVNLTQRFMYVEGNIIPPQTILVRYRRASVGLLQVPAQRVRTIQMPPFLIDILNDLKQQRSRDIPGDFLFSTRSGKSIPPVKLQASKLKPIARQLGVPFSWHDLKQIYDVLLQDLRSKLDSELWLL